MNVDATPPFPLLTTPYTPCKSPDAKVGFVGFWGSRGRHVSPDGTKVAFVSVSSDFGPTDSPRWTGNNDDLYVRDLTTGTTTLVSVNAAGTDSANGHSVTPVFSPDSTKIAFMSAGSDLGAVDTNDTFDIYLRDLTTGTTTLVSANGVGTAAGNSYSQNPVFSPDGSRIAFESAAEDLGTVDTNS